MLDHSPAAWLTPLNGRIGTSTQSGLAKCLICERAQATNLRSFEDECHPEATEFLQLSSLGHENCTVS